MRIIMWFLSLLIFSWCYSMLISCIINYKKRPETKISIIFYAIIVGILYAIAYYYISKYYNDILVCSIVALILSILSLKKE